MKREQDFRLDFLLQNGRVKRACKDGSLRFGLKKYNGDRSREIYGSRGWLELVKIPPLPAVSQRQDIAKTLSTSV